MAAATWCGGFTVAARIAAMMHVIEAIMNAQVYEPNISQSLPASIGMRMPPTPYDVKMAP